nr:BatA [uncultured bacterium]
MKKNAFTVFAGDKQQEITYFGEQDLPVSIGILLDTSGSMEYSRKRADLLKDVVAKFVRENNPANEYFVMGFKNKGQLLVDWTKDVDAITGVIKDVPQSFAGTAIFDTCYEAIEKLKQRPNLRRAILLITDGQDTVSQRKNSDLFSMVKQTDVMIYSVRLSNSQTEGLTLSGVSDLDTLSSISGGQMRPINQMNFLPVAAEIFARELRHQYVIGFTPTNLESKWHRVKVKVLPVIIKDSAQSKPVEPLVQTRQGFSLP